MSNKNNYLKKKQKKQRCIFVLTVGHAKLFKLAKNEKWSPAWFIVIYNYKKKIKDVHSTTIQILEKVNWHVSSIFWFFFFWFFFLSDGYEKQYYYVTFIVIVHATVNVFVFHTNNIGVMCLFWDNHMVANRLFKYMKLFC